MAQRSPVQVAHGQDAWETSWRSFAAALALPLALLLISGCGGQSDSPSPVRCEEAGCAAGEVCQSDGTCAALIDCATAVCTHDACHTAACDPQKGCVLTQLSVGTPCGEDLCARACDVDGICAAEAVSPCVAAPCELAACDPKTGACDKTPLADGEDCDDSDPCTGPDLCLAGACSGQVKTCDDAEACTVDACDPETGCTHTPKSGPCDDGSACTLGDSCATGSCAGVASVFFSKLWGGVGESEAYGLALLVDGFAVVGYAESADGDPDGRILKAGAHGGLVWSKTFGGAGIDLLAGVLPRPGGGLAAVGSTESIGAGQDDAWLLITDKDGALQTEKTFGGAAADEAEALVAGPKDSLVVVGRTASKGAGGTDGWMLTLDASGKLLSDRVYGGVKNDGFAGALAIDGGFVLVGRNESSGMGGSDAWVVRVGPSGAPLWDKVYGGVKKDEALSVAPASGGGFVVVGRTASAGAGGDDGLLLRLSDTGALLWQRTFGAEGPDVLSSVAPHAQGYALVGTRYDPQAKQRLAWLMRVSPEGVLQLDRTFSGGAVDIGHGLLVLSDAKSGGSSMSDGVGGLVMAGSTKLPDKGHQVALRRMDDWGNASCAASLFCSSFAAGHCDDINACTLDLCKDGACASVTLSDGAPCGTGLSCLAGVCGG